VVLLPGESSFEALSRISVEEGLKIASRDWDGLPDNLARIKTQVITSTMSVQARVDETQLRAKQLDVLPKLLELMASEAKKIPPMLELESNVGMDMRPHTIPTQ
jgi:hypothetical protein